MTAEKKRGVFFPLVLGLLTAFGPFVTDFYLPVLPEMSSFFATAPALVSMSLTMGMLGLALGQLFIGPLTDKYGRKRILVGAMALFVAASIGCILSTGITAFNILRFFQGLGGAGGIVISKSMASDVYSGRDLMKFMGILAAINGIAPVVAPLVGGAMSEITVWQGIFGLLAVIGALLGLCCMRLPETLLVERRVKRSLAGTYVNLFRVLRNPDYVKVILFTIFGSFCFFGYIASSPFILQDVYGLSAFSFSLCFGLNAVMIGVGSGVAALFKNRVWGMRFGGIVQLIGAVAVAACLFFQLSIWSLMSSYIIMLMGFGLWQPGAASLALDLERNNAGSASAVFGASMFVAGGLSSPLVALGNISITSGIVLVAGALLSIPMTRRLRNPA